MASSVNVQFEEICRTCMGCSQENPSDKTFQLQSLFDYVDDYNKNRRVQICDILNIVVHQLPKIDMMDEMPNHICTKCLEKLFACYEFQNSVKNSDQRLRTLIQANLVECSFMETGQLRNDEHTIESFIKQEVNSLETTSLENEMEISILAAEKKLDENTTYNNITENTCIEDYENASFDNFETEVSKTTSENKTVDCAEKETYKKVWQCKICSQCFLNKKQLALHLETGSSQCKPSEKENDLPAIQNSNENISKITTDDVQLCSNSLDTIDVGNKMQTDSTFEIANNLDERNEDFIMETWLCKKCENIFFHMQGIKKHMQSVHNEELKKHKNYELLLEEKNKEYRCDECDQVFLHLAFLKLHKLKHKAVEIDKSSTKLITLIMKCSTCDEVFESQELLKQHKLSHEGQFPFKCRCCNKSFKYNCHLLKHELTHSSDELFFCARCRKAFNTINDLREHAELHENEKRFQCAFCPRKFHSYGGAYSHQRRVHNSTA